jgi:hypothetical protein
MKWMLYQRQLHFSLSGTNISNDIYDFETTKAILEDALPPGALENSSRTSYLIVSRMSLLFLGLLDIYENQYAFMAM